MQLSDLIREVGELPGGSNRTDQDVKRFVNRAVREICARKNFTFTADVRSYVIQSGNHSVSLGPDYKCLSGEESPVSVTYNAGNQTFKLPVRVLSLEEVERQSYWPWIGQYLNQPTPGGYIPIRVVYFQYQSTGFEAGTWRLHIPAQFYVIADAPYNVSAFFYPPELKLPTDHNAVTDDPHLADATVNYAKALKYFAEDETSKRGVAAMALYEDHFSKANYTDAFVKYSGRTLRM
jgi:hypothetical protein